MFTKPAGLSFLKTTEYQKDETSKMSKLVSPALFGKSSTAAV